MEEAAEDSKGTLTVTDEVQSQTSKSYDSSSDSLSTRKPPLVGEDIENHTPPQSPIAYRTVESLCKQPRGKMTLSPSKAALETSVAFVRVKQSGSKDKSSSDSDSLASGMSNTSKMLGMRASSVESDSSEQSVLSQGSTASSASHARKARKSVPSGKSAHKNVDKVLGESSSKQPVANMTLKLCEIEKTLGIKTLNNIDAKRLDKLILEKTRIPRKDVGNRSRTCSPDVVKGVPPYPATVTNAKANNTPESQIKMVSILKKNNVLAIKLQSTNNSDSVKSDKDSRIADINGNKEPTDSLVEKDTEMKEELVKEMPIANDSSIDDPDTKSVPIARKKRKRKMGNYNLPGQKKNPKKKVQYAKSNKVDITTGTRKNKGQTKTVIEAHETSVNHDDSYETLDEMEVSQTEDSKATSNHQAQTEVKVEPRPTTPRACSPVLYKVKEVPDTSTPLPAPKSSSESRPVLGGGKKSAPASVQITPQKIKKAVLDQPKVVKESTDSEAESLIHPYGINPKTRKPYIRGPYKRRKNKEGEEASNTSNPDDMGVDDSGVKDASMMSDITSPVQEASSKKPNSSKRQKETKSTDSPAHVPINKKRAKGLTALPKAKRPKLAVHTKGLKVAMATFFKKKQLQKVVSGKNVSKPSSTSDPAAAVTTSSSKQQRTVMDMFSAMNRRQSAESSPEEEDAKEALTENTEHVEDKVVNTDEREEGEGPDYPDSLEDDDEDDEVNMLVEGRDVKRDNELLPSTVNTSTQIDTTEQMTDEDALVELTDPDFIPVDDPAIMELPPPSPDTKVPTTLAELKATLDAEAEQQPQRKKRKRRGGDGDASMDGSDSAVNSQVAKRLRAGQERQGDESLGVSPLCPRPHSARINTSKASEQAATASTISRSSVASGMKYINTPNGVQYPVTPPKTPEGSISSAATQDRVTPQLMSPLAKGNDFLPLCCCRINGAVFNTDSTLYCQALDSIDGKIVGCCNKVTSAQLVRPAVKVPFMAICEVHRRRLKLHHCCPGCGHFCTQGTFLQCKKDSSQAVHQFHRQCQVYKDSKYFCPHCGEESMQYEVYLRLHEPHNISFFPRPPTRHTANVQQARMGSSTRPNLAIEDKPETKNDEKISFKLANGKELKPGDLKYGPSQAELQAILTIFKSEKPKKLRMGPKSLYHGAKTGDMERVIFMLMEGCDPNYKNEDHDEQTAVHAAAFCGNPAIMNVLVQAGADIQATDADLNTPLMVASARGQLSCVAYLVKSGAVPRARRSDGMTALHLAAQNGHIEVCKYLLYDCDININAVDDGGWTALIWAAEHKHRDCVKFLLKKGGNPNIRDNEENTGLHWAVFAGSVDIAEVFLDAGCNIECPNEHGDRALHIAARQGHYECVVLLLARGAISDVRNNDNDTPETSCAEEENAIRMALKVNRELKGFAAKRLHNPVRLLHRDISMGREVNPIPVVNDFDDENYPADFHYVSENVETSPMMINRVVSGLQHCACKDDCESVYCVCTRNSVRCWYDKEGRLESDFNQSEPPLIFECNKACKCWSTCRNRVVQLGITCRLEVFRTNGRGWGMRTSLDIKQGTFVCEYVGEHISDAEADAREDDSYLFDLDNKDSDTFCIDARHYANAARFINHLCKPNVIPVKVFIEHQDLRFPRICLFASRDIQAGEELGFDYGEKFWIIKWKQFTCECKAPNCKYSKDTIHQTIAEYNKRQQEEESVDDAV